MLVCPQYQQGRDWAAELDACHACGSTMLHRALGETTCGGCGNTGAGRSRVPLDSAGPDAAGPDAAGASEALRDDVGAALARMLRGGVH